MDEVDALSSSACKLSLFRLACHAVMDTVHLGCAYQPEVRHPAHGLIRRTLFSVPMSRPVQLAHRVVIIGVLTPRVVAIITRSVIPSSHRASSFVDATAEPVFFFSSFGHRIALFRFATSCSMALRYYDQHHNAVDDIHREPRSTLTAAVLLPMIFFWLSATGLGYSSRYFPPLILLSLVNVMPRCILIHPRSVPTAIPHTLLQPLTCLSSAIPNSTDDPHTHTHFPIPPR